jgi:hypothetical protein
VVGIPETGGDQASQRRGEASDIFGKEVKFEGLDGDDAIALRIEAAENRTEDAAADLMQHAVLTKRGRRTMCRRLVNQCSCS